MCCVWVLSNVLAWDDVVNYFEELGGHFELERRTRMKCGIGLGCNAQEAGKVRASK